MVLRLAIGFSVAFAMFLFRSRDYGRTETQSAVGGIDYGILARSDALDVLVGEEEV